MKKSKIEKCSLCLQEKELLKKSHIIPDFWYRNSGIYNKHHKIHKFEIQEYLNSRKISFVSSGEYENGILCKDCDNKIIGNLETYGRKVLYGGLSKSEYIVCNNYKNSIDGFEFSVCEGVNYHKFKLFLLSILWRASISNRKTFREAKLDSENNELIRKMIFTGDAGKINQFPIVVMSYTRDTSVPLDLMIQPIKSSPEECELITFLICGFVFSFNITNDYKNMEKISNITICPDNKFTIMHFPSGETWKFIFEYLNINKR